MAMVPEGLVLLTSLAFAVAVMRLARRRVLVQELQAVEGLARVDVLCIDKTGTLTEGKLTVQGAEPVDGAAVEDVLGAIAANDAAPNATMRAIAERYPQAPAGWEETGSVPFSSARKWSAAAFDGHGAWVLGAPDVLLSGMEGHDEVRATVQRESEAGHRVVLLASAPSLAGEELPARLTPAAVVVLGDSARPDAAETLRYFAEQGVRVQGDLRRRSPNRRRDHA